MAGLVVGLHYVQLLSTTRRDGAEQMELLEATREFCSAFSKYSPAMVRAQVLKSPVSYVSVAVS
jgi:hypothetical protein